MDADRLAHIQEVFLAALDQPADARDVFLDEACDGDAEVRAAVVRYLRADEAADSDAFLDASPVAHALGERLEEDALQDDEIGPYRVLRPLGHGGMGNVYLAVREKPFRRYVALKLIRRGTDSSNAIARFAVERQILASLDHPGVARLFDGGVTGSGRPYFAMEYVDGQPITAYCNERRLSVEDRLRLFIEVCEAVHYAHQNLVLHRDLKPSNILVTTQGGGGAAVKLLDFGIAKLLNPQMSSLTVAVTQEARPLLTPEYASPEQIRGEPLTTASDVYSLGILLYELLTGRRPHRLEGRSLHEMMQIVSSEATVNPSTAVAEADRASRDGETGAAEARQLTPEQLQRRLRGDLDAVCLKALRKEPDARYGSAELLKQDVERYLAHEPVEARRGSRRYRAASFVRRHRVGVGATVVVVLALAASLAVAIWTGRQAAAERDRAEQAAAFMTELLGDFDPNEAEQGQLDIGDLLDRAVERVDERLGAQPEVQAQLYTHLGRVYVLISQADVAERLYERALALRRELHGEVHPEVAKSLNDVAWIRWARSSYQASDSLYALSLEVQDRLRRPVPLIRATTLNGRAYANRGLGNFSEGLALAREAHALRADVLDPDDPLVVKALSDVGSLHYSLNEYDEAAAIFEHVVDTRMSGVGTPLDLADALTSYGAVLTRQENYEEAARQHEEALAIRRQVFGDLHPKVAESLTHLGWGLQTQERYAEAEPYYREALDIRKDHFGPQHLAVGNSLLVLGEVVDGEDEEGPRLSAQAARLFREILGPRDRTTLFVELRHAKNLARVGRAEDARAYISTLLPDVRAVLGPAHPRTLEAEALLSTSDPNVDAR